MNPEQHIQILSQTDEFFVPQDPMDLLQCDSCQ